LAAVKPSAARVCWLPPGALVECSE